MARLYKYMEDDGQGIVLSGVRIFFAKYAKRLERDRGEEGMAGSAGVY
jgi:hypothetical protein